MIQYEITNEPKQAFIIPYEDTTVEIDLEFLTIPNCWIIGITYKDNIIIQGLRLNSALILLDTYNLPFDIYINDVNSLGLDPFDLYNFSQGLHSFNLVTRSELTENRGYEVQ